MENINKSKIYYQRGITLIALVLTIIVLIILASITVNIGMEGIKEAKANTMLSDLAIVQNAILQRKTKADLTDEDYPGEVITQTNIDLDDVISEINNKKDSEEETVTRKDTDNQNYYYLSTENGGLEDLGITNSEDDYIVNYETGEVINYTTKVTGTGIPLYIY